MDFLTYVASCANVFSLATHEDLTLLTQIKLYSHCKNYVM